MNPIQAPQHLPGDVVSIILFHLSAKPLLRFRSVCKLWRQIIYSPYFITCLHLPRTPSTNCQAFINIQYSQSAVEKTPTWEYALYSTDGVSIETKPAIGFEVFQESQLSNPEIVASCDGLVLVQVFNVGTPWPSLHVANPTTRKILHLPLEYYKIAIQEPVLHTCGSLFTTFLFDSKSLHYKVLLFWRLYVKYEENQPFVAQASGASIFTIGKDKTWRHLTNPLIKNWIEAPCNISTYTTITNGAFHFFTGESHHKDDGFLESPAWNQPVESIIAFDISCESFRVTVKPTFCCCADNRDSDTTSMSRHFTDQHSLKLATIEGALYLFDLNPSQTSLKVWILEDYAKGVWIKISELDARDLHELGESSLGLSRYWVSMIFGRPLLFFRRVEGSCYSNTRAGEIFYYDPKSCSKLQGQETASEIYELLECPTYLLSWARPRRQFVVSLVSVM